MRLGLGGDGGLHARQICKHGRRRTTCKECGGSQICEHGRQRTRCKECGGGSFCEHGKRRQNCIECGGSQICEHGRQRSKCKECGGGSICKHGKLRYRCQECGGSQICEHGKRRDSCKQCRDARARGQKRQRQETPAAAPKRPAKRRRRAFLWPSGAPPGVPVTAATGQGEQGGVGSADAAMWTDCSEAPRKPTRYEAMWTDCDPSLWEYVVV